MRLKKLMGSFLERLFLQAVRPWGASITLDENGKIVDELEEKTQKIYIKEVKRSKKLV